LQGGKGKRMIEKWKEWGGNEKKKLNGETEGTNEAENRILEEERK
jgi:hypothetical protein